MSTDVKNKFNGRGIKTKWYIWSLVTVGSTVRYWKSEKFKAKERFEEEYAVVSRAVGYPFKVPRCLAESSQAGKEPLKMLRSEKEG